jgi:hypothetical protein
VSTAAAAAVLTLGVLFFSGHTIRPW